MTESTWGGARPVTRPDDKRVDNPGGKREGAGRTRKGLRLELGQKVHVWEHGEIIELMVHDIRGDWIVLKDGKGKEIRLAIA